MFKVDILESKSDAVQDAIEKGLTREYEGIEYLNNYVCLDGTTIGTTCAEGDLYRIIGLFKNEEQYEIKLIKATSATTTELGDSTAKADGKNINLPSAYKSGTEYYWNSSLGTDNSANKNIWKESNLNKVNLNGYYLNNYLKEIKNINIDKIISTHTWIVGGNNHATVANMKIVYDYELGANKVKVGDNVCYYIQGDRINTRTCTLEDIEYKEGKIGLMYVSDYGYAASPTNWTIQLYSGGYDTDEVKNSNWLYNGESEWTISRNSSNFGIANVVSKSGSVSALAIDAEFFTTVVRPVFYLASNVKLSKGEGSRENPFVLETS